MMQRTGWMVCHALAAGLVVGCATESEEQTPVVMAGPLELDPTENLKFEGWWSNGAQMLLLEENGGYTLWDGTNQYRRPREIGRWSQPNYFELWIEPYQTQYPKRVRLGVKKIEGKPTLSLADSSPMLRLEGPPTTAEDALFGTWMSGRTSLRLDRSMQYEFASPPTEGAPIALTRHHGRWRLVDDQLTLEPDTPVVPDRRFTIIRDSSGAQLSGEGLSFTRPQTVTTK